MPSVLPAALLLLTISQAAWPAGDQKAHAAAVLASMAAGDFAAVEAQFDDRMKAALPAGRLAAAWNGLLAQVGALKGCGGDVRVRAIADKQMVITPCDFERAKVDVQLAFGAGGTISGFTMRPAAAANVSYALPPYAVAAAFSAIDVTIGSGEWTLPGTLTIPAGAGPFSAVVLVHGSGPNDRDETVGANKPFADLAAGLASRGVAVLRYDKRTKVYGARMAATPGLTVREEVVDDALAAIALLRGSPRIDPSRVFVLGHSLGGMLIPRIAAADPHVRGVIVMAGAARPLEDAIVEQTKYLASADGTVTPDEQKQIDEVVGTAVTVRTLTPADAAAGKHVFNAPASYWLDLRGYDAPAAAKGVRVPMLILQGERDYQVTMGEFARWKAALAGRSDVTYHSYPALNHLFLPGTGKSVPLEYEQPSHVAEDVVNDIACWVKGTCR